MESTEGNKRQNTNDLEKPQNRKTQILTALMLYHVLFKILVWSPLVQPTPGSREWTSPLDVDSKSTRYHLTLSSQCFHIYADIIWKAGSSCDG